MKSTEVTVYTAHGKRTIDVSNKEGLIRLILELHRDGSPFIARNLMRVARKHGYDYPEFETIEKSIEDVIKDYPERRKKRTNESFLQEMMKLIPRCRLNEVGSQPRIVLNTPSGKEVIWYADKHDLMNSVLYLLRVINPEAALRLVNLARENGFDYPEFKTIEKSANAELARVTEWGGGGRASNRTADDGYRDDHDMQFINRKKGKKVVKNIIVKEGKPTFGR